VIVGAEAAYPMEFAELRARRHVAGRLSVELNVGSTVDQFRNPLLREAALSLRLVNGERPYPRWSASVHLASRVNTLPITAAIGIFV